MSAVLSDGRSGRTVRCRAQPSQVPTNAIDSSKRRITASPATTLGWRVVTAS